MEQSEKSNLTSKMIEKLHRPKQEVEFDALMKKKDQNVTANLKNTLIKTENIKFKGLRKIRNASTETRTQNLNMTAHFDHLKH